MSGLALDLLSSGVLDRPGKKGTLLVPLRPGGLVATVLITLRTVHKSYLV